MIHVDPVTGMIDGSFRRVEADAYKAWLDAYPKTVLTYRQNAEFDMGGTVDAWEDESRGAWPVGIVAFQRHENGHYFVEDNT